MHRLGTSNRWKLSLLSSGGGPFLCASSRASRRERSGVRERWELEACSCREALWTRSRLGTRSQYSPAEGAFGEADLPHRSFSRQRDGAEYHDLSFREWLV